MKLESAVLAKCAFFDVFFVKPLGDKNQLEGPYRYGK